MSTKLHTFALAFAALLALTAAVGPAAADTGGVSAADSADVTVDTYQGGHDSDPANVSASTYEGGDGAISAEAVSATEYNGGRDIGDRAVSTNTYQGGQAAEFPFDDPTAVSP